MSNTIPTPQTPSFDEYSIVATFSEQSLDQLSAIQSQLVELLGDNIWLTPRRALHSTLMEIICDREYEKPRKQLFDTWYEQYNHITAEVLAQLSPFDITFSELEFSQRAIIARLSDSTIFNGIRTRLLSKISLPNGTKLPPDITHISLARYNSVLPLEAVTKKTSSIKVNFTQHISNFKLLKELGPPAFQPTLIQEYKFGE